jgi:hypothetical protein
MAKKSNAPVPISETITILNKVSSKSVHKNTGKNWDQWIKILDDAGARNLTHKEIVAFVVKKYKLSLWWRQWVTSGYEVYIGRKIEGRNDKGEYATVATKSFAVEQKKLWRFLLSPEGQKIWLKPLTPIKFHLKEPYEAEGGIFGEIRTMKAPERMRLTWQDTDWEKASVVQLLCHARPNGKTMLGFQHEKLKDARLKKQMLEHWKAVLGEVETAIVTTRVVT